MDSNSTRNKHKLLNQLFLFSSVVVLLSLNSCYYDNEEALYLVRPGTTVCDTTPPLYAVTILPIMQYNCVGCHSGGAPSGNLDLTNYENVMAGVNSHHLWEHVTGNNYSLMPPSGSLSDCNINQLNAWIARGMPAK